MDKLFAIGARVCDEQLGHGERAALRLQDAPPLLDKIHGQILAIGYVVPKAVERTKKRLRGLNHFFSMRNIGRGEEFQFELSEESCPSIEARLRPHPQSYQQYRKTGQIFASGASRGGGRNCARRRCTQGRIIPTVSSGSRRFLWTALCQRGASAIPRVACTVEHYQRSRIPYYVRLEKRPQGGVGGPPSEVQPPEPLRESLEGQSSLRGRGNWRLS